MNSVKIVSIFLCLVMLLCACSQKSVMTVGNEEISYDMYRYFYLNYKAENNDYTETKLRELTISAISGDVAITHLADKYEIKLTFEDKEKIKEYVDSAIESYDSKDAYKKSLAENYLTEKLFKHFYSQQLLEERLRKYMMDEKYNIIVSDDATFEKDLKVNFMAAKQILIRNDEGDDIDANRELAEEVFAKARNGEDFDALIHEYSEDSSADAEYVYHFTHGQLLEAFEEAVEVTEIGEICSHIAESEAGFHIVMRMPLDPEFIDKNYEDLRYTYKNRCYNEIKEETASSFAAEFSDDFEELTFE